MELKVFHGVVEWEDAYFDSDTEASIEEIASETKPYVIESVGWVCHRGGPHPVIVCQSRTLHSDGVYRYGDILRIPHVNVRAIRRELNGK